MIREMCLTPLVLLGVLAATSLHTDVSPKTQATTGQGAIIEVMTCDKGWGLDAKASTNGLYAVDLQYGFKTDTKVSVGFIPKLGISYVDHPVKELPQRTQFSLGAQFLVGYESYRVGIEYWHLSNGSALGLNVAPEPNIGMDMISVQVGKTF